MPEADARSRTPERKRKARSGTPAKNRVTASPATMNDHQAHGPRHWYCEMKVIVPAANEAGTRRHQRLAAGTSATASGGHR